MVLERILTLDTTELALLLFAMYCCTKPLYSLGSLLMLCPIALPGGGTRHVHVPGHAETLHPGG